MSADVAAEDTVVIACAADAAYVKPLATMLRSVVESFRGGQSVDIYVLHSGIGPRDRAKVQHGWPEGCRAHWIEADSSAFEGLPLWGRMPVSTYFRLAMSDLLPQSVTKAIWLDCDLLVVDDITPFWKTDLRGCHAGATQDAVVPLVSSRCGIARYAELGMDPHAKYFNAGVMLVDLELWRRDSIQAKAIDYLRKFQNSVMFWDQEGLNAVLVGKWMELDKRWNLNASIPGSANGVVKPAIVHFAGSLKPWKYRTRHPLRSLYYQYLDRTAFAGWRPEPSFAAAAISLYEGSGLRSIMYPAENLGMRVVRGLSQR